VNSIVVGTRRNTISTLYIVTHIDPISEISFFYIIGLHIIYVFFFKALKKFKTLTLDRTNIL